ncbi:MAG: lysylphosphatidylglycerol synthase transmembrane domain-containing protein [Desulfatiglandales bacterium]
MTSPGPLQTALIFIRRWGHFFLLLGFLALLAKVIDWSAFFAGLGRVNLLVILYCLVLEGLFYSFESVRVYFLGQRRYPFALIFKSKFLSSLLANFLPGLAVAEMTRIFLLDAHKPGGKFYVALLLVANRIYGLFSLAGLFLIAFVLGARSLPPQLFAFRELIVLGCALVLAIPLAFRFRPLRGLLISLVRKSHGLLRRLSRTFYIAMANFSRVSVWWIATATSMLTSFISVLQFWIVANMVGIDLSFWTWTLWTPLIAIVTFLPIGFGAFGSQEAGVVAMSQILGEPLEPFLVLSVIIHFIRIAGSLPGLLFLSDGLELLSRTFKNVKFIRRFRAQSLKN